MLSVQKKLSLRFALINDVVNHVKNLAVLAGFAEAENGWYQEAGRRDTTMGVYDTNPVGYGSIIDFARETVKPNAAGGSCHNFQEAFDYYGNLEEEAMDWGPCVFLGEEEEFHIQLCPKAALLGQVKGSTFDNGSGEDFAFNSVKELLSVLRNIKS